MLVVHALSPLAGADGGEHFGQSATHARIDEGGAAAWFSFPPTVIAAAVQPSWSLNEHRVTLQSVTLAVMVMAVPPWLVARADDSVTR
jgi:hypothetical protein